MGTQVQWRRGTAAENDAFTGAVGEITVDNTNGELRVHNGATAGGFAAVKKSTVQSGTLFALGSVAGTADAITAAASPTLTAYTNGNIFSFIAGGANTGATTINIDGLGDKSITKQGATALSAGNIANGMVCNIRYDGTRFQLLNPIPDSGVSVAGNNTWTGTQSFSDNKFEITDNADATKKLTIQASGITAGTTRTATVPDADFTMAGTNVKQTFTKQQTPMNGTLTDGATINWDGDTNGQVVAVTLGGNRTMAAPTNIVQYSMYVLRVTQDATGSRTLSWNAAYKFNAATAPTLSTTAAYVDILMFIGGAGNTLEYCGISKDVR